MGVACPHQLKIAGLAEGTDADLGLFAIDPASNIAIVHALPKDFTAREDALHRIIELAVGRALHVAG
jgi:hypothetical protein